MESRDPDPPLERLLHHRAWLRALAARLVGATAADDLVQDTWLAALQRPPDPTRPPRPWLSTVARRLAGGRRKSEPRPGEAGEGKLPSTAELIERIDTEKRLASEVARLDEPFRTTVLLRYYEGLSSADIARRQGVPGGTVRWRLKRGLELLRERLDGAFGDRRNWGLALGQLLGGTSTAAVGAATLASGGIVMSSWVKVGGAAVAAVVLLAGGLALREVWLQDPATPSTNEEASLAVPPTFVDEETAPADLQPAAPREGRRAATQEPAASPAPSLRLRILEWDGRPNAGLLAVLVRPDGKLVEGTTDEDGRVAFPNVVTRRRVVIDRHGAPPHAVELAGGEGEQVVRLPRGEVLAGRVLVDGGAPERPLELELVRSANPTGRRTEGGAPRAGMILGLDVMLRTKTATDGSFRFVGLDADWRGNLQLPRGYAEAGLLAQSSPGRRPVLHFSEPEDGLVVELERFPRIHGRIVDRDGAPVPGAQAWARLTWSDGTNTDIGANCDAEGRFEVFLEESDYRSFRLEYWGPGESGKDEVELRRADVSEDGDVGLLRLAASRDVRLVVVDEKGLPIVGARTNFGDAEADAAGEIVLAGFSTQSHSVWVRARGFLSREVEIPASLEDVLKVVLEPTNELAITVVDRAGTPMEKASIELRASESPSLERSLRMHEGHWSSTSRGEGGFVAWMYTDDRGRLSIQALRPDVAFTLLVPADCGTVVHAEEVPPLEPTERRSLVLRVEHDFRSFAARVVDGGGEPIPRAVVGLRWDGDTENVGSRRTVKSRRRTNAFGEVTFARLGRPSYRLEVTMDGYLPHTVEDYRPWTGETVELVLVRGHDVEARVVDENGRPVPRGRLAFDVVGERRSVREKEPGRFELRGLADTLLEVTLTLAGATYRKTHDPREPELSFVVPIHGAVEVSWDHGSEPRWKGRIRIVLRPREQELTALGKLSHDTPPSGSMTFPVVLPGEYEIVVLRGHGDEESEEELTERVPVTVEADGTARATLRP